MLIKDKSGLTISLAVIAITIITLIIAAMFTLIQHQYFFIRNECNYIRASAFSDIGIKYALYLIDRGVDDYDNDITFRQGTTDQTSIAISITYDAASSIYTITSQATVGTKSCLIAAETDDSNVFTYTER